MFKFIKENISSFLKKESDIEKGNIVRIYGSIKKSEEKVFDYFFSYVNCIEETDYCNINPSTVLKNIKRWHSIKLRSQYSFYQKDICYYIPVEKNYKSPYEPDMFWKKIFICDEVEKENYQDFFKEKFVYPRDNIFVVLDKIRLGFRFSFLDDPEGLNSRLQFNFPEFFYCLLIDGKKTWLHENNIEKVR